MKGVMGVKNIKKMKLLKKILLFSIILHLSCYTSRFKKYESDWLIAQFKINEIDAMEKIYIFNFTIDVENKEAYPPTTIIGGGVNDDASPIQLIKKEGKDLLVILEHPIFQGEYELNCLDELCCELELKNGKFNFSLEYNGDIPFGISRKCN